MRKGMLIIALCVVAAVALVYTAHGQSREDIDKLKAAQEHIKLLGKVNDAIKLIEKERELPKKLHVFDVEDLLRENSIADYAPPSPFVFDVESGFKSAELVERESFEEGCDSDTLIELVRVTTGEENWPEEEGGFGTITCYKDKLIIVNTPEMIEKIKRFLDEMRRNLPVLISSTIYLLGADEDYLKGLREEDSSVVSPQKIKKAISDARPGGKVELLRTGYLTAYSSQAAYLYSGTVHTYQGDTDTSGAGGLAPVTVFDPIVNIFREGFIIGLRAQYNRQTSQVNLVAMVSLSKLTAIEEHTAIGGGIGAEAKKCKVETPKVDLQIVSGSADVPAGCGLLLGGSRMKTTQAKQKSFVVLIVPEVQK